ncbi:MAG: helix-turn-helix transcriptional regulator [Polyangiaceae bacterium]|nr:helix-turn-helix transcriptional regulator [Polyangiaceae bacterium]MCW5792531.1 helix-turn-helix transcriptional regulator [Polyangiaceae bacterium]
MTERIELTIEGRRYVAVPEETYRALTGEPAYKDALVVARAQIAADLRAARQVAGLSQAELAKRMGKSQPMVARAEAGETRVGERYVKAVLKACGLPMDWVAP